MLSSVYHSEKLRKEEVLKLNPEATKQIIQVIQNFRNMACKDHSLSSPG